MKNEHVFPVGLEFETNLRPNSRPIQDPRDSQNRLYLEQIQLHDEYLTLGGVLFRGPGMVNNKLPAEFASVACL